MLQYSGLFDCADYYISINTVTTGYENATGFGVYLHEHRSNTVAKMAADLVGAPLA